MRVETEPNASSFPQVNVNSHSADQQARFTEYLQGGVRAAQAGDRKLARNLLMSAVDLDPHSENAWLWLASISEYPEELLVFLNNVLDINPQNERALQWSASTKTLLSKTLVQRGIDASEDGRLEFAMQCFDQALSYDERNVNAWLWLASLADSESRKMEYLRHVLMIEPNNDVARSAIETVETESRATLLTGAAKAAVAGDSQNAMAILEKIEDRWPGHAEAWIIRSHLVWSFEEKMAALKRVLDCDPASEYAVVSLASLRSVIEMAGPVPEPETVEQAVEAPDNVVAVEFAEHQPVEQVQEQEMIEPEEHQFAEEVHEYEMIEPGDVIHDDYYAVPTHELPPIESILGSAEMSDEFLGSVEPVVEPADEPVVEQPVQQSNSPWESKADENQMVDDHQFPTIDAFNLSAEVPEIVADDVHEQAMAVEVSEPAAEDHYQPQMESFVEIDHGYDQQPHASFEPEPEPIMPQPEIIADHRIRVLIVDDSATARKLIAGKLEASGFNVLCAENGGQAIEMARTESPSLALVDIAMPMMDGYAVCRALRDEPATHNVPVVMISGKDGYYEENRGVAAGASGFITKPFGPETLMKTVEGFLSSAAPNN